MHLSWRDLTHLTFKVFLIHFEHIYKAMKNMHTWKRQECCILLGIEKKIYINKIPKNIQLFVFPFFFWKSFTSVEIIPVINRVYCTLFISLNHLCTYPLVQWVYLIFVYVFKNSNYFEKKNSTLIWKYLFLIFFSYFTAYEGIMKNYKRAVKCPILLNYCYFLEWVNISKIVLHKQLRLIPKLYTKIWN